MPTWYIAGNERKRGAVIAGSGGGPSSIVVDGAASAASTGVTINLLANGTTLTTTLSNDVVIAFIMNDRLAADGSGTTVSTVVGSTLGSFTFYARKQATTSGGDFLDVEIWYVVAASPVTAENVTVVFAATADNVGMSVQAFNGVKTTGIFDTNGSLPATGSDVAGTGGSIPTVGSVSTTKSHTVLLGAAMFSAGSNTNAQDAGTGYTAIHNITPQAGTNFSKMSTEYQTTEATTPQSGQTVAFNAVWANWAMIVCALVDNNAV